MQSNSLSSTVIERNLYIVAVESVNHRDMTEQLMTPSSNMMCVGGDLHCSQLLSEWVRGWWNKDIVGICPLQLSQ